VIDLDATGAFSDKSAQPCVDSAKFAAKMRPETIFEQRVY